MNSLRSIGLKVWDWACQRLAAQPTVEPTVQSSDNHYSSNGIGEGTFRIIRRQDAVFSSSQEQAEHDRSKLNNIPFRIIRQRQGQGIRILTNDTLTTDINSSVNAQPNRSTTMRSQLPKIAPNRVHLRLSPILPTLLDEVSWRRVGNCYMGVYRVGNRTWQGKAEFPPRRQGEGMYDFYCYRPPKGIRNHSHSACWRHTGDGWYWIHFTTPPKDLLSGIKNIQTTLSEVV
jgi:hypothetical protein